MEESGRKTKRAMKDCKTGCVKQQRKSDLKLMKLLMETDGKPRLSCFH